MKRISNAARPPPQITDLAHTDRVALSREGPLLPSGACVRAGSVLRVGSVLDLAPVRQ